MLYVGKTRRLKEHKLWLASLVAPSLMTLNHLSSLFSSAAFHPSPVPYLMEKNKTFVLSLATVCAFLLIFLFNRTPITTTYAYVNCSSFRELAVHKL